MEREKDYAIREITIQILNMMYNNIIEDYGNESFIGWCEDGAIFERSDTNYSKEQLDELENAMHKIAPLVDKLTYSLIEL